MIKNLIGIKIPYLILKLTKINSKQKILLALLFQLRKDSNDFIYLNNIEKIAEDLNYSIRYIKDSIKIFEESHYITKENNKVIFHNELINNKDKKFLFLSRDVLELKNLTETEKLLLSYFIGMNKSFDKTLTSNKSIMKIFNISLTKLSKTLVKFRELGFIEITYDKDKFLCKSGRTIKTNNTQINNYIENKIINIEKFNINNSIINIINLNLNSLENIELTEEQKQLIKKKLKL